LEIEMKQKFSRRDFLKLMGYFFLSSFVIGAGGLTYGIFVEPNELDVEEVEIKLSRLPSQFSGYRIVQFSDLHMGGWLNGKRLRKVVDAVVAQQPDLVVITGDFFTGPVWNARISQAAEELVVELSRLTAEFTTLGVLGNHDYWSNAGKAREALQRCGVIEIGNGLHSLERNGEQLHVAGVDDIWYGHDDLDKVLSMLPETGEVILLAHEPDFADKSAGTGRFGLQLSGHSHGGQIVLPFFGPPVLPWLGQKYPIGLYKVGEMWQYTNRGVGMTLPVRINCPAEVTVFTLNPA
jgi:predicted MPP superfamily phosphohydrolase